MTRVTNPQKIWASSFLDQLGKITDEFETCIDFVSESSSPLTIKLNSETYISKVRGIILSVGSFLLEKEKGNEKSSVGLNSSSNGLNEQRGKVKARAKTSENKNENKKEIAQLNKKFPGQSKSKPKSKSIGKSKRSSEKINTQTGTETRTNVPVKSDKTNRKQLKFGRFIISEKRAAEIEKADKSLRAIKTETGILYKCVICHRKLNTTSNARRHVLRLHFKQGLRCQTCKAIYFQEQSLQLHISKCKKKKLEQIKVQKEGEVEKGRKQKKEIKVHFHPNEKQPNPNERKNIKVSRKNIVLEKMQDKTKWEFDPKNVTVRNPFVGFSLEKSINVKIPIDRLQLPLTMRETGNPESISSFSMSKAHEIKFQDQDQDENPKPNAQEKQTEFSSPLRTTNLGDSNNSKVLEIE